MLHMKKEIEDTQEETITEEVIIPVKEIKINGKTYRTDERDNNDGEDIL